jgi:hypothetical protein
VESVENSKNKSEFPTLSTGLGSPARTRTPAFHISTAPAAGLYKRRRSQGETQTDLQLTDGDQFKHHNYASVASLRP